MFGTTDLTYFAADSKLFNNTAAPIKIGSH